jgi:hypothetical protein
VNSLIVGHEALDESFTRQPQVSNITHMSQKSLNCNASVIFTILIFPVIKFHPNNVLCLNLAYPIVRRAKKQNKKE